MNKEKGTGKPTGFAKKNTLCGPKNHRGHQADQIFNY